MVRILVDYGSNVDVQNGEGQTALHICAAEGDESLLKYFYGVRASASIADKMDRTPMHVAAGLLIFNFFFLAHFFMSIMFNRVNIHVNNFSNGKSINFRKWACKCYRNFGG